MVTGVMNSDGSITANWEADDEAESYLAHYGDANTTDPHDAKYMGYTETNSFHLDAKDVPAHVAGDKIPIYIQAYTLKVPDKVAPTNIDKARYLHDGPFTGSAWSAVVNVIAN